MKNLINIISNEHGHGYGITGKDLLKIVFFIVTAPVSIPVVIVREKLKKRKSKD